MPAALAALLAGTGLQAVRQEDGHFALRVVAASGAANGKAPGIPS